jgi:hypothetical protein
MFAASRPIRRGPSECSIAATTVSPWYQSDADPIP